MSENNNKFQSQKTLKIFFVKLISILIAVVIAVNLIFNLIFGERLERIDKLLLLDKSEFREEMKMKIRKELNKGLNKENSITEEDKILLYKFYMKLRKEFQDLDKSKL